MPGFGKYEHQKMQAEGNAVLLVIVNSVGSYWDYSIVEETVLDALEHFGMPYRVVDLSNQRLNVAILKDCAAIVLAQARVGMFLTEEENTLIADSVNSGVGLVALDNDVRYYSGAYHEIFGFEDINPHPYASNILHVRNTDHYISKMQEEGELHKFDAMVTAIAVGKWRAGVTPIADCILAKDQLVYIRHITPWSAFEPRNWPTIFAGKWGKGRAVQFLISPRMWKREFYGHTRGADDLFWRSLVWAARKPFVANMIPPFVTMSFDDCSGRHDFKYVSAAVAHGYIPLPSLFLSNVDESLFPLIHQQHCTGVAEYNTHAISYYNHMYHAYGRGAYTKEELDERFGLEDAFWAKVGITPSQTVRFHCGEMGVNALPYLKERNRLLLNPSLQTGLLKADMCMADGFYPYGLQSRYYDYLPDDHSFFAFNSMLPRFSEDFLTGCTVSLLESPINDVKKAATSLSRQIRDGLRAGFFADIVTHEQKFEDLSLKEWEQILDESDTMTKRFEKKLVGHDTIGNYLKSLVRTHICAAIRTEQDLHLTVSGSTDVSLMLSVFDGDDDSIERTYREVVPFSGQCEV